MYRVFWYESGTGEKRIAGPFKTKEEAEREPFKYLYPPETKSITVFKCKES